MQIENKLSTWRKGRRKRPHWAILTLDDLPKNSMRNNLLITKLQARYKAAKEVGDTGARPLPEDFSI